MNVFYIGQSLCNSIYYSTEQNKVLTTNEWIRHKGALLITPIKD
jgi:hypothetical protein